MRDREVIDSELRLLATLYRTLRYEGGTAPSIKTVDEPLEERCTEVGESPRK